MTQSPSSTQRREQLIEHVARFPENPGVYIMKNGAGLPIYIGKAVNLRSRVRSYFLDTHADRAQIPLMLQQLEKIDWIATNTEAEALILEANLIRQHRPPYNIDLRDDKHYPYLKVTLQEPFPRLLVVRRIEKDGARYFGPYTDVSSMRRLVVFAKRIFKLCDCTQVWRQGKTSRPCLNYSMHRCSGACAGKITPEAYRAQVDDLLHFLAGRRNHLLGDLEVRMEKASAELRFEDAALLRDQIKLIRDASRLQQVDLKLSDVNCDVFGLAEGERHNCLAVLLFREGLLIASRHFLFKRSLWDLPSASHESVILQYYQERSLDPPHEIVLPEGNGFDPAALQVGLATQFGGSTITVHVPQKGIKRQLVAMAEKNARLHLAQKIPPSAAEDCADLQKALHLPRLPETIEAFDISNLGESFAVAGMVQFKNGVPNKSGYRRFKIKTVAGQNDFAMMMEAVSRRLTRLRDEGKTFPDLLLIDGGKGQLSAAMAALASYDDPPPVAALAKKEEILFSPFIEEPLTLPAMHPARRLVERIRNEVHRYAIGFHRKVRGKQFSHSTIEELPGIGPAKARLLLKTFGSVKRLKAAPPEEIANVPGFTLEKAIEIKAALEKMG
jgi:excinuclease ABC subunit C